MRHKRSQLLLAASIVGALLLVGVGWVLMGEGDEAPLALSGGPAASAPPARGAPEPGRREAGLAAPAAEVPAEVDGRAVSWPLELALDLVDPAELSAVEGDTVAARGRAAALEGRVVGRTGEAVPAEVRFLAGLNRGRTLRCDSTGRFGANDLLPGIAICEIDGPGIPLARREVKLLPRQSATLNVSFQRASAVYATVVDEEGAPVAGAEVELDGQPATSDVEGLVYFAAVAPGTALVVLRKPGYASYREELNLPGGTTIAQGKLRFVLRRGASLDLRLGNRVGTAQPSTVYVLPSSFHDEFWADGFRAGEQGTARLSARGQRVFPWSLVSPQPMYSGRLLLEDLPAGRANVWVFHPGAAPSLRAVTLREGKVDELVVDLEPAPLLRGKVTRGGAPAARARVRLRAPDLVTATLRAFGERMDLLFQGPIAPPPAALSETWTDDDGSFEMTAWHEFQGGGAFRLEVRSEDEEQVASRVLKPGEREVELALEPVAAPAGRLVIALGERRLPLPVEVRVDGAPRDPVLLAPGDPLVLDGLREGSWQLAARWHGEVLVEELRVEITPAHELALELPAGAILGQDADERARAGR